MTLELPFLCLVLTGKGFILKTRWPLITGTKEGLCAATPEHRPNIYINLDLPNFLVAHHTFK